MGRVLRFLPLVAACMPAYHGGTLPAAGQRFECVDVWLEAEAATRAGAAGPVVVVHLGNRCDHAARVDLTTLHVIGNYPVGGRADMVAYDPDHEIEPRDMDAYASGDEWIEYHSEWDGGRFVSLDVDVGRIAGAAGERWIHLEVPR